ncbi:MAG: DnaJ domain-containing protein, partial [Nannocystis sp.]
YTTLGVPKTADAAEIKRAYRKLTQQYHPDKNPGDAAAESRFKDVSTAYDVLSDADKRKNYDEFGDMSLTQGFDPDRARAYQQASRGGGGRRPRGGPGGMPFDESFFSNAGDARGTSFDDLLSQMFGGGRVTDPMGGRGRRPVSQRGHDIEGEITIDFMDMLRGKTVPLRIESEGGGGRSIDVKVPPGIADGGKLRLRGKGGAGDPPGDIILTVKVAPHPRLKREGSNLQLSLPVTVLEAYRGGPIDVPTPTGKVTLKLKAGSQNGQTLRLKGKGIAPTSQEPGDLLVTLDVRLPPPEDAELLAALERLQAGQDPRADLDL